MFRTFCRFALLWGLVLLAPGCATDPRDIVDYSTEPIGMQLLRAEPMLKGRRFNTLLIFESPDETVFVMSHPDTTQNTHRAHTGKASSAIGTSAKINLASVLINRAFPGDWTLVGGYLYSERPAQVDLVCSAGNKETRRTLELPAGKWTPAFADLTQLKPSGAKGGEGSASKADTSSESPTQNRDALLTINSNQPILCDDVMILDNSAWYVSGDDSPWVVKQRGFKLEIEREGWFKMNLDTVDMSRSGWSLEEASAMRATFSSTGKTKRLAIYSDGRSYWDGRYEGLSANAKSEPALAREHESPGAITVAEGMGRVDRSTAGDANNDAYNELLGAYEMIATGPRTELTLTPRGAELVRPIVEIAGLPPGKPLVTLEGRLVESLVRLKNGNVLVEIPARLERPTTLNVRIETTESASNPVAR